ncbi:MAG TPA: sortase [Candidatus Solibacter sp.]|nr:sortase [Candidatus Solibacter sp.]
MPAPAAQAPATPKPPSVPTAAARLAAATAELDPVAAMVGETISKERELELRRAARRQSAPPSRRGLLYDTRFLVGLFVVAMAIFAFGIWQLVSDALTGSVGPGGGALLPGDGVSLPGGPVLPILVVGLVSYFAAQRLRRPPRPTDKPRLPGKGWRWAYDSRVISSAVALVLVFYGFSQLAPPGSTVDLRELPGEVNNAIQAAVAQPESGFPRIKISNVNIDLLITKGDGKTPPVKYEAFTYPGADHLLTGDQNGGSNTYVYAHARNGMFWRLHDLHIGNIITIDYGGGKTLRYRVSEIHPSVNWKDLQWLQPTTDDRLTLQTCNGWKDDDPRFIVVALRIPDATALR